MKKIGLLIEIYEVAKGATVINPVVIDAKAFKKFTKSIKKNEVKRIKI